MKEMEIRFKDLNFWLQLPIVIAYAMGILYLIFFLQGFFAGVGG